MKNSMWKIEKGNTLTRFLISLPVKQRFALFEEHETMIDRVQYKFQNGFVDVGDLPCRKHFWSSMANRKVDLDGKNISNKIYFSNGNRKVDFSGFIHTPTHVQRWAETTIFSECSGDFKFRLATCGGVRIWNNEKLVSIFTPFQRNKTKETEVIIPLSAGENRFVIHAEELFERDTQFFFELTFLDERSIYTFLPDINSDDLEELESFVTQISFEMNVTEHRLELFSCNKLDDNFTMTGNITGMSNEEETNESLSPVVANGSKSDFYIDLPKSLKPAHFSVNISFSWRGVEITRSFGINVMPGSRVATSENISERKANALAYTASDGMNITGKLLALLELNQKSQLASVILNKTLQKISAREDCSDFWMVSVLWAWHKHSYTQLPDKLWDRTRSSILGYRYWLDEPGNDAMWFWSENHVLCFHVSQLLAGQFFPNDKFLCSGRLGKEQKAIATDRLNRWFEHVLTHGLTEWNSSCYYPIDYIGLLAIYELAECPSLRNKAKIVMDRLMLMAAVHYQEGVAGGTMGRVYEKELMANEMTELAGFGHVAWGSGWHTRMCASLPMFCLSGYQPSDITYEIATLPNRNSVEAHYTQGMDRCAKVVAWKQPGVSLSCVVDHHTGSEGHQQHALDIQFATDPKARLWINHPGEEVPGGDGRPSYWAGNGILPRVMQSKGQAMMVYDLGLSPRLNYTHLYLPAKNVDQYTVEGRWCFIRCGDTYAVIGSSNDIELVSSGVTRGREIRSFGTQVAWYVSVGQLDGTLEELVSKWSNREVILSNHDVDLTASLKGASDESFSLSWTGECYVNEARLEFPENVSVDPVIKMWSL